MRKSKYSEEQIIGVLRQVEKGQKVPDEDRAFKLRSGTRSGYERRVDTVRGAPRRLPPTAALL